VSTAERSPVQFNCWESETFCTVVEDEAVEWAKARTSVLGSPVTIEASSARVDTFALRRFHHDGTDSGWSCFIDGAHSTTQSLDVCFARDRSAVAS